MGKINTKEDIKLNLIYKVEGGERRVVGALTNNVCIDDYIAYLNNSPYSANGVFESQVVNVFNSILPHEVLDMGGGYSESDVKVRYFAEVVGKKDCTRVEVLSISTYSVEPRDYVDSDGLYHLFYALDNYEEGQDGLTLLYSELIRSFCEVLPTLDDVPLKEDTQRDVEGEKCGDATNSGVVDIGALMSILQSVCPPPSSSCRVGKGIVFDGAVLEDTIVSTLKGLGVDVSVVKM